MAPKMTKIILLFAIILMTWHGVWAQSSCMNAVMSLAPCSGFLTGAALGPSFSCCSQLNWVMKNQPECMCSFMKSGGAALGIVASQTSALALPGACSFDSSSVGQCNVASGPTTAVASPASAPMGSQLSGSTPSDNSNSSDTPKTVTPTTPSQTTTPSSAGTGSKTVPSTKAASSGATITKSSFSVALLLFLAVSLI